MAAGDLSADQERYATRVATGTGLSSVLVRSWIGAESGWAVTKGTHNYLNIGPGRSYESVDQAADAVIDLIRNSDHYAGIRASIPLGPALQAEAIQKSPWDAAHYDGHRLVDTLQAVLHRGGLGDVVDQLGDAPGQIVDGITDEAGAVVDALAPDLGDIGNKVLLAGLGLVFTLAAFVLIAMGLNRLTGQHAGEVMEKVATVAKVAAV